jgi:hypothetical protein
MSFGTGWALLGLAALVPLVVLHLRDRSPEQREVPSVLLWRDLEAPRSVGTRGLRLPQRPLLLLLEALTLVLFVLALAQPHLSAKTAPGKTIFVIDDSLQMSAPGRLPAAESAIRQAISRLPSSRQVDIVLAQGDPRLIYRGGHGGVAGALQSVTPSLAPSSLSAALTVAAGVVSGPTDTITVVRAAGDPLPSRIDASRGELRTVTIGAGSDDQGIFDADASCSGSVDSCEVQATLQNLGARRSIDDATAIVPGKAPLHFRVTVPAGGIAPITLGAVAGEQVTIRLDHADAVAGDNTATVSVPQASGLPAKTVVTLVGQPSRALALAQAFAAVPGVELKLLTPGRYRSSDARSSGLVILDNFLPKHELPPSPSVLLVDPPRIPGGRVGGSLADTVLAGTDATSPLLSGVDLSSLAINRGGARALTALPKWIVPVAWTPAGPLLAAGDDGQTRVAILAFEPSISNLPQLTAFPLLAANIVGWASGWAPTTAAAGEPISVDATAGTHSVALARDGTVVEHVAAGDHPVALTASSPGLYTITESGPDVSRRRLLSVSDALPQSPAAVADLHAVSTPAHLTPAEWSGWLLLAGLVALALEWVYWILTRPRPIRLPL